ncbi:MaoC/PaaZ C-terminal domain-containing protein [Streptomyces sp. H27-D2]|uniref:MaoC/PaaZ C-terminal domain-containing protein n=1 Tax=Streptomyces sp. H27-D2 TaxID=3046304 RepID=UPI002DB891B4|nr:MaoC/PaaZ C-terminal domain-containing protein [Streptomyces sp. H27-D2]MEC4017023.1 MaoC/PaaZ C-terminal domain-containing protein [Streptomyces sp. H27-D2]
MTDIKLSRPPRLMPALGRGVLTGIGKRPGPDSTPPDTRLVLAATRIDVGRTAAYARLCGYRAGDPLPPTYPHILGFPLAARLMSSRAFPLPLLGLVHTGIEITQYEPLRLDDAPELTVYAEKLIPHPRGTEVVVVTEARRGGALVWRDLSRYLARHRTADSPATPAPRTPPGYRTPATPAPAATARRPLPEEPALPVRATWELPANLGRRHAAVSGDYNPIHLYPLTAKPLGFPRAIAHGMWTLARCVAEAAPAVGDAVRIRANFRAPVLLPATVAYAASYSDEGATFQLRGGGDGGGGRGGSGEGGSRLHLSGTVRPV